MHPVPPPPDEIDFTLVDRFLAGECTPEEAELVRRWLVSRDANAQYWGAVRDALQAPTGASAIPDDPDTGWARLARDTIDAEQNADRLPPPLQLTVSVPRGANDAGRMFAAPWLRVAAAITVVAGVAAALWVARNSGVPAAAAIFSLKTPMREYATARGERAELRLPDGTRIVLAPDSRLEVPADFAAAERTVALVGHAYFEVKYDARKPFQVRAGNAVARDLGTRFDVRAYPDTEPVRVQVAEGKVQLTAAAASAGAGPVLGPGDVGRIDAIGTVTTGRTNLATALAWVRGELVFDDVPLSDVATEVGRWYDLDVQIADSLLRRKRVKFTLGAESAPDAVEAVALLAGARYEQHGRRVTLIPPSSLRETGR